MTRRLLLGTFASAHDLLETTRSSRERGLPIVDAFTPYPVHGLDEAMGLKRSRLGIVCFLCGVVGVAAALAFQHWTLAIDWPINVGGRPFNSWPAFVPVAFEVLVLFAGFGVVFAFLGMSRLYPGSGVGEPGASATGGGVTNNQFMLVIEAKGSAADADVVFKLFREHHAVEVQERDEDDRPIPVAPRSLRTLNGVLLVLLAIGGILNWMLGSDHRQPNREFLPEMVHAVPHESFGKHPDLPNRMVMQAPPEGSIARGHLPLHFQATPKDAERAGEELLNPFKTEDARWQKRGAVVFANYCALCHGTGGAGDGPVSQRGMSPPPSLLAKKATDLKDGQIFHIITYGQGNMPAHAALLARADRWAAILHVGQLQNVKRGRP